MTVKDPWLRRQLTPDFSPGCKRMLVSSDYYPALQRDNCKLIDWPIATLSPVGIRTSDGIEHHLDCIVFATGYDVHLTGPPFPITGLGGRSLSAEWRNGAQAYKSVSVHGYPNLFFMTGSELRTRPQLTAGLHRRPAGLRGPRHHHHPEQRPALSGRARTHSAPAQRAHPEATDQDDVAVGLPQLVSHRRWIQCVDVSGVRHPVPAPDAGFPARRLPRGHPRRRRALSRQSR